VTYTALNRYADAVDPLRQAVRLNPEYVDAWYMLGLAYAGSGDRIAALDCVAPLRRLDPARADALFNAVGPR
jgi:tetratricopeptide (TPR) repeat protein